MIHLLICRLLHYTANNDINCCTGHYEGEDTQKNIHQWNAIIYSNSRVILCCIQAAWNIGRSECKSPNLPKKFIQENNPLTHTHTHPGAKAYSNDRYSLLLGLCICPNCELVKHIAHSKTHSEMRDTLAFLRGKHKLVIELFTMVEQEPECFREKFLYLHLL